jgi:hypothetical protein
MAVNSPPKRYALVQWSRFKEQISPEPAFAV